MKNNWIAKAGAAAVIVGCAGAAAAQVGGQSGLSARIGVFLPTDTSASDLRSTWFAAGIDYKLNNFITQMTGGSLGYWGVSVDYYATGGDSNIPVVVNYNIRQQQLVYSLGAGVDFFNIPDLGSSSGTGFDVQAAIAYDISKGPVPIFVQAKYFLAGRSELRGFGLYAGVRF